MTYVILQQQADYPWTLAKDMQQAAARLALLMLHSPREWAGGGILSMEAYEREHDARWLNQPPRQITESEWIEMLEVLPPLAWKHDGGVERFNMSEFTSGLITSQYGRFDGICLHKYVRHGDRDTYLNALSFQPGRFVPISASQESGQ